MAFWNRKKIARQIALEVAKKTAHMKTFQQGGQDCFNVNSINFQIGSGATRPYFETYIRFYQSILPLGDAIDLISTQFSTIIPKIFDTKTKEFSDDHEILELLKNPNTNVEYCEFAENEASLFELTGNQYWIMSTSKIDGEPLELFSVHPQDLSPSTDGTGTVESYIYSPTGQSITFNRQFQGRQMLYVSQDGRFRLFQLKRFNPNAEASYVVGLSKLHSMFYDLEQYRLASIHNQSLLSQGGRPSGMLSAKEGMLTPDQNNDLRGEFDNVFAGAMNAGRPLIASGMEWTEFAQNNRDMDFSTLKTQLKEGIYNRLRIPLSLVNSDALSLANMEVAMVQLYMFAVLPLARKIFGSLTMNVLKLYPDSEDLILTFDPSTIPALRNLTIEEVQKISSLNVFSDNEIRNRLDAPSYDGGDEIYKPSTMIPVGEASNMSNVDGDQPQGTDSDDDTESTPTSGETSQSEDAT